MIILNRRKNVLKLFPKLISSLNPNERRAAILPPSIAKASHIKGQVAVFELQGRALLRILIQSRQTQRTTSH